MAELSFGEWLKRQRGARGWTQKELALQINCSISALRKMESEERHPSVQVIQRLAEIFEIPPEEQKSFVRFARGDWQAISGRETEDAPWRISHVASRSNLPSSMTSFIGREKEIDEVANLIAKNRLVTVVGAGGIGKTRLALQVGQRLLNDYQNGVCVVALDSLSDPALVPQTVASVFDIREGSSDQPLLERLIYTLSKKTTLLILDNCEHLLDACAHLIMTLLTHCPNLKILATSREILNMEGEASYSLPSLSTPDGHPSLETLTDYEAIRLFAERASLALASFRLTRQNAQSILDICRRVDGIPLAIELAAARVDILSVDEILRQLNHCFDLLVGKSRTAITRHQTMRASIDWSWGLLNESEQGFMSQLSVFAGGWTLDSAQTVCEGEALGLTSALVKKSLIVVNQEIVHETRYHFHEIVRQYAHEKLVESGEEENLQTRHLKYFLELSQQAEPALRGPAQIDWMSRLNNERNNIRAALDWADQANAEAGLYMSGRLHLFWASFDLREGSYWLSKFLQKPESQTYPRARAKALSASGYFLFMFQRFAESRAAAQECLDLYRACGDKEGEIDGLLLSVKQAGYTAQRKELGQRALVLAKSINDKWRQAHALFALSWGLLKDRQYIHLNQALKLLREVGDLQMMAGVMAELGRLEMLNNDIESAQEILNEAVILVRQLNLKSPMVDILQSYGRIAAIKGDYEQAYASLQESAAICEEQGIRMNYLFARTQLGYLALYRGEITDSRDIFGETLRGFINDKNEIGVAFTLEGISGLSVAVGKPEIAAQLVGRADMVREKISDTRPPLEQAYLDKVIAACLEKMGEAAFSDAYDEGQKMTLDAAVALALNKN